MNDRIRTKKGALVDINDSIRAMDQELFERVKNKNALSGGDSQSLFDRYCEAHRARYKVAFHLEYLPPRPADSEGFEALAQWWAKKSNKHINWKVFALAMVEESTKLGEVGAAMRQNATIRSLEQRNAGEPRSTLRDVADTLASDASWEDLLEAIALVRAPTS